MEHFCCSSDSIMSESHTPGPSRSGLAVPPRPPCFNVRNGKRKAGVLVCLHFPRAVKTSCALTSYTHQIVGLPMTGKRTVARGLTAVEDDDLELVMLAPSSSSGVFHPAADDLLAPLNVRITRGSFALSTASIVAEVDFLLLLVDATSHLALRWLAQQLADLEIGWALGRMAVGVTKSTCLATS